MQRTLNKHHDAFHRTSDICDQLRVLARVHRTVELYPSAVEDVLKDIARLVLTEDISKCEEPFEHLDHFLDEYPRFTGRVEQSYLLALGYKYDVYFLRLLGMVTAMDVDDRKEWNAVFKYIVSPAVARRRIYMGIFGPYVAELQEHWTPQTQHQTELALMAVKIAAALHCGVAQKAGCAKLFLLSAQRPNGVEVGNALAMRHPLTVSDGFIELLYVSSST